MNYKDHTGHFSLTTNNLSQPSFPDESPVSVLHERLVLVLVFVNVLLFLFVVLVFVGVGFVVVVVAAAVVVVAVLVHVHAVLVIVVVVGFRRRRQHRSRARDVQGGAGRKFFRFPVLASVFVRALANPEPLLAPPAADIRTSPRQGQKKISIRTSSLK